MGKGSEGNIGRRSFLKASAMLAAAGAAGGASGTSAYAKFTYAVATGWQKVVRPRIRCNSFAAVVWSTSGRWAISKITAVHRGCGRIRR